MEAGCCAPDTGLRSTTTAGSTADSGSSGEPGTRASQSSENVPAARIELTSSTTWQVDVTAI